MLPVNIAHGMQRVDGKNNLRQVESSHTFFENIIKSVKIYKV